jgi:hypothetical protein
MAIHLESQLYKEGRFILAQSSRSFHLWSVGSIAFGPVERRTSWWQVSGGGKAAHLLVAIKQREGQDGARVRISPARAHSP